MRGEKLKTDRGKTGRFETRDCFLYCNYFPKRKLSAPSVTAGSDTTAHTVEFSFFFSGGGDKCICRVSKEAHCLRV